jgi:hypothetical protein
MSSLLLLERRLFLHSSHAIVLIFFSHYLHSPHGNKKTIYKHCAASAHSRLKHGFFSNKYWNLKSEMYNARFNTSELITASCLITNRFRRKP